jgi:putative ubiquitin-RnfH superfamily antitoxin RatB of RatAB toxin-antitoxin module
MDQAELAVTVVYCAPGVQDIVDLRIAAGSTVRAAVEAAGVLERHPGLLSALDVGIWGRVCSQDEVLRSGDRIEIYRPLQVDPKEARRVRARVRRKRAAGSNSAA